MFLIGPMLAAASIAGLDVGALLAGRGGRLRVDHPRADGVLVPPAGGRPARTAALGRHQSEGGEPNGLEVKELRYEPYAGIVGFPELAEELGYLAPLRLKYMGSTIRTASRV